MRTAKQILQRVEKNLPITKEEMEWLKRVVTYLKKQWSMIGRIRKGVK